MSKRITAILVLVFFVFLSLFAFAAPRTLTGTVSDTMCGKTHMIAGKSDAECTRECMKSKGNWTYALVVGDTVYSLIGDNRQFDSFAGKRVKVTGDLDGSKVLVRAIESGK
jgi:hypothetical protein